MSLNELMAVEGVCYEPFSGSNSLLTGKNRGKFLLLGRSSGGEFLYHYESTGVLRPRM
jgi:hypothetical protein